MNKKDKEVVKRNLVAYCVDATNAWIEGETNLPKQRFCDEYIEGMKNVWFLKGEANAVEGVIEMLFPDEIDKLVEETEEWTVNIYEAR